jgi:hypothetical protein
MMPLIQFATRILKGMACAAGGAAMPLAGLAPAYRSRVLVPVPSGVRADDQASTTATPQPQHAAASILEPEVPAGGR